MSDNVPTEQLLVIELKEVTKDWELFGVSLGVPVSVLDTIKQDDPLGGVEKWKLKMFQFWLQDKVDPSWKDVVRTLEQIDKYQLAATLSRKYLLAATAKSSENDKETDQVVVVPMEYREEFEDIQCRFLQLFDEITETLENEESITLERLKRFVSGFPDMKESIANARTIPDIIDVIQEHSSITSCIHLKGVAKRFNISVAYEKIEEYYRFVEDFCRHKLANHVYMKPLLTAKSFTPSTTITFKLRWSPSDRTLHDIQHLLQQAFDEQSIYVHIVVVRGG